MKSRNQYIKERGVTLVELLVGLAVGFIVVGGIIAIYSGAAGSSASTIRGAILNQELNAIMQLVTNDIRRAGYWFDTNTTSTSDTNPFTDQNGVYNTTINTWSSQPCITYAYDLDQDSRVGIGSLTLSGTLFSDGSAIEDRKDNMEIFGLRYNATDGALEMRTGGSGGEAATQFNCTNGSWQDLNDSTVVTIDSFTIDTAGTSCINTSQPRDKINSRGYSPGKLPSSSFKDNRGIASHRLVVCAQAKRCRRSTYSFCC